MSKFFVATYTNECKQYCDDIFFTRLQMLSGDRSIHVVDNSLGSYYLERLKELCPAVDSLEHIEVAREPKESLFNRNVFHSVSRLRDAFLKSDSEYFVTIESDVLVPKNLLELFEEVIDSEFASIGGIYYAGFHSNESFRKDNLELEAVKRTLSGCTLYKRLLVKKVPFRWDPKNLADFPDTFMSYDAAAKGHKFANYNKIKCGHLSNPRGLRGHEELE